MIVTLAVLQIQRKYSNTDDSDSVHFTLAIESSDPLFVGNNHVLAHAEWSKLYGNEQKTIPLSLTIQKRKHESHESTLSRGNEGIGAITFQPEHSYSSHARLWGVAFLRPDRYELIERIISNSTFENAKVTLLIKSPTEDDAHTALDANALGQYTWTWDEGFSAESKLVIHKLDFVIQSAHGNTTQDAKPLEKTLNANVLATLVRIKHSLYVLCALAAVATTALLL